MRNTWTLGDKKGVGRAGVRGNPHCSTLKVSIEINSVANSLPLISIQTNCTTTKETYTAIGLWFTISL